MHFVASSFLVEQAYRSSHSLILAAAHRKSYWNPCPCQCTMTDFLSLSHYFFQPYSHPSVSLPSLPSLSSSSSSSTILLHLAILLPWSCTIELTFKQSSETSFHLRAALCLFNRDLLHFWDTILLIQGCLWYAASALQKASPLST